MAIMPLPEVGPLDAFWRFVHTGRRMWERLAQLAVTVPIIDLVACVGPPWPNRPVVVLTATAAELVVYVICFEFFRSAPCTLLRRLLLSSTAVLVVAFISYAFLFGFLVHPAPGYFSRAVGGWQYTAKAEDYKNEKGITDDSVLLAEFGNNVADVWTESSLVKARVLIWSVWLLLFASLSFFFAVFLWLRLKKCP